MRKYITVAIFFSICFSCKDEELNYNPFDEAYVGDPPVTISSINTGEKYYYIKNATDTIEHQDIIISVNSAYKYGGYILLYRDGKIISNNSLNPGTKSQLIETVCVYSNKPTPNECFSSGHTFVFQTALMKGSKYSKQSDPFSFSLP